MLDYKKAYKLFHDGVLCLAECESFGVKVNLEYVKEQYEILQNKMDKIENLIFSKKIGIYWKKKYGANTSIQSNQQLIHILYEKLKLYPEGKSKGLKPVVDKDALSKMNHPLCKKLLEYRQIQKSASTYLAPILRETQQDGRMRFFFPLNLVQSYRSSSGEGGGDDNERSSAGNFQNQIKRNTEMAQIVRNCFVADEGCRIVSRDFSALEVRILCSMHRDPRMIEELKSGYDSHKEIAKKVYYISDEHWDKMDEKQAKQCRFFSKNMLVFALSYGDWWMACAPNLWRVMDEYNLMYSDKMTMKEHITRTVRNSKLEKEVRKKLTPLRKKKDLTEYEEKQEGRRKNLVSLCKQFLNVDLSKGLDNLSQENRVKVLFAHHIGEVEEEFWNVLYTGYRDWKKETYNSFLENGFIDSPTGFRYEGKLKKNHVNNYAAQGSAFHQLLWSMIEMQKDFKRLDMKTKFIGEIHDDGVAMVPHDELNLYDEISKDTMENKTIENSDWIVVPLPTEIECSFINGTWGQMISKDKLDKFLKILEESPENACNYLIDKLKYDKDEARKIVKTELKYLNERQIKIQ